MPQANAEIIYTEVVKTYFFQKSKPMVASRANIPNRHNFKNVMHISKKCC